MSGFCGEKKSPNRSRSTQATLVIRGLGNLREESIFESHLKVEKLGNEKIDQIYSCTWFGEALSQTCFANQVANHFSVAIWPLSRLRITFQLVSLCPQCIRSKNMFRSRFRTKIGGLHRPPSCLESIFPLFVRRNR